MAIDSDRTVERIDGQILRGLLDSLVLRVLADGDSYGFEVQERVSGQLGGDRAILREATLYPLLHRLEEKGLLTSYSRAGLRGTPRKYYRLTRKGRDHLDARIGEWRRVAAVLEHSLFKSETA